MMVQKLKLFSTLTKNQREAVGLLQIGTFLEYFDLSAPQERNIRELIWCFNKLTKDEGRSFKIGFQE